MPNSPAGDPTLAHDAWLPADGEIGSLIKAMDWSKTPLGPIASWPQSLKTTLGILLHSRYPMFVFWGPQLVKIYNDAYRPITGSKHPWALGRPGAEVWPEIWGDIKPLIDRALAGDPTWSHNLPLFMDRNGFREEVYFTFSYSPVPDETGRIGGMFCACTETSAQVVGERRLRTLRDLTAAPADAQSVDTACTLSVDVLAQNAADVPFALLYLADARGTFHLTCQSGVATGHPAAPQTIAGGDDTVWPLSKTAASRTAMYIGDLDTTLERVPAGPWPESPRAAMALPLLDRGMERAVGAVVLGISARRPFDDTYREWFTLVAAQIGSSIANARAAEEERKRADALANIDRAKTAFFSNVSHEFRTPLTLLLGPIEDALATPAGKLQGPELETAHRNALRLLALVNSLLDFSRIEAGRTVARFAPADIGMVTADLASAFRAAVEKAGLAFHVDATPLDEPVYIDHEMWEKVVFNLLSNALKYTFEGSISVAVRRAGDMAELVVRDTGIGIASEHIPHLFERFHRVAGARARTHEGTGIGLALVHELVKLHGGHIRVDSTPGLGSTFIVTFPFGYAHLPEARVQQTPLLTAMPPRPRSLPEDARRWFAAEAETSAATLPLEVGTPFTPTRGARIVVADDNADMREYVTRLLQRHWRVEAVADGEAALAAVRRDRPDLVLADVMMPGIDGYELLRSLREDDASRKVPVILLSARAGEEARVEGMTAGADDYLAKPFSSRELIARVAAALELTRVRQEGQEKLAAVNRDLQNRVAELETLLNVIPIGIGIALDRDCRTIKVNPAFADALGLSPDENASLTAPEPERPTGFRVLDSGGREIAPDNLPLQVAAREGRAIRDLEVDIVHDDGRVTRLIEYAVPLFDDQQQPRGSIGAFVDITERTQIEARNQFLVRLDDAVRTTADPAVIMQLTAEMLGTHLGVSRCAYADVEPDGESFVIRQEFLHDIRHASLVGRWALSAFGHHVAGELRAGRTLVIRDATRELGEDAAPFTALSVGATICAAAVREGRLSAMMAVHHATPRHWTPAEIALVQLVADRSWESIERARAVRELGESELRYRTLFNSIDAGFCTCEMLLDQQGRPYDYRFLEVNTRFATQTGLHDVVGRTALELLPGLERHWIDLYGRVALTGEPARFEQGSDAMQRWFDVYAFRFGPAEKHTFGILFTDITERKRIEANLRQTNRMKDEFLATLSHELRTPLNAVLGWTHMIRTGALRKDLEARALESLERNAKAQAQLVDDLLDVSRIISGKLQIARDPVALNDVVAAALETIYPAAINRGVVLRYEAALGGPVVVTGDADRLRQVVWNLLSNAVKFTASGGTIEVRLRASETEAAIIVRDTGQGIEPDFLPYVFDRFRQADSTPTRRHGGLGLGLAIVRHLIEAHGGTVEASSDGPGTGATFTARLPRATIPAGESHGARRSSGSGAVLRGARILVVDDEPDARELLKAILENVGARVTAAESAGDALLRLEDERFDLLVADIGMPDQDGFSLIRTIRGLSGEERHLPAVAVTAYASARERACAIEAGYGCHVAKPVDPEHLISTIGAVLEGKVSGTTGG